MSLDLVATLMEVNIAHEGAAKYQHQTFSGDAGNQTEGFQSSGCVEAGHHACCRKGCCRCIPGRPQVRSSTQLYGMHRHVLNRVSCAINERQLEAAARLYRPQDCEVNVVLGATPCPCCVACNGREQLLGTF